MTKIHRGVARLKQMDMFYLDTRAGGPTILCLHGRWGRAETWSDFIQRYGQHYRVIAPDQRGHGLSGKPDSDYTAEEMAEDVNELLTSLALESVVLVGHSMGGRVAGYVAALYPQLVKAVAILDRSASVARIGTRTGQIPREDPLTGAWPMPFATLNEAKQFIRQATDSDLSYQYFMNSLHETVAGYQMLFSGQAMATGIANDQDWFHLLPKIECPALLIRSKSHEAIPDEDFIRMQALIPNCTAREMSHPDHNVQLANKEEFYDFLDGFLDGVNV